MLDEIWSFQLRSGRLNVKKSFGTALKFFGKDRWANVGMASLLATVAFMAVGDPMLMHRYGYQVKVGPQTAEQFFQSALQSAGVQPKPEPDAALLQR